jgi:hypothetical protein
MIHGSCGNLVNWSPRPLGEGQGEREKLFYTHSALTLPDQPSVGAR